MTVPLPAGPVGYIVHQLTAAPDTKDQQHGSFVVIRTKSGAAFHIERHASPTKTLICILNHADAEGTCCHVIESRESKTHQDKVIDILKQTRPHINSHKPPRSRGDVAQYLAEMRTP